MFEHLEKPHAAPLCFGGILGHGSDALCIDGCTHTFACTQAAARNKLYAAIEAGSAAARLWVRSEKQKEI